jgi:drug/metabolite transporter (DMT)-like permease
MTERALVLPVLGLMLNAFTWGVSWWPFRWLAAQGLHPLWATAFVYGVAVLLISLRWPRAWGQLWRTPALWWLVLAAGTTNAAFNSAVTFGDVVRIILLFYLMPLWAVLLARVLLGERLSVLAGARVVLALAGAAIVLWPADGAGWPVPGSAAEWLAVLAGFAFALNNVMLRRLAGEPREARSLAMFSGGVLVSLAIAASATAAGALAAPPAPQAAWVAGALVLAVVFLVGNLTLQYGAARLPANVTAVVMVSEVLFASLSAVALGAGVLSLPLLAGGALILAAALLAACRS